MGRKMLALVPALDVSLERFHADAAESPLYLIHTWTTADRKRQVAIAKGQLLELQRLQSDRSWFVGNGVQQDGSLTVFTRMDPLFVLLAASWAQRTRFTSVYDLLARERNTWWLQLCEAGGCCSQDAVEQICDVQGGGDDLENLSIKASESKVLKWLTGKTKRIAQTLATQAEAKTAQQNNGAFDDRFVLPDQTPSSEPKEAKESKPLDPVTFYRDAINVLGNYVPEECVAQLFSTLKVEKAAPVTRVDSSSNGSGSDAINRFDTRRQTDSSSTNKRATPPSASSAKKKSKLANVDRTGMKSLTSFFGKK